MLFNTAPQFVGASNTLRKTNIVETQSYYIDTMVLGVDLCAGLMAFGFTSVAQPQMLIEHSSNFCAPRFSYVEPLVAQGSVDLVLLRRDVV